MDLSIVNCCLDAAFSGCPDAIWPQDRPGPVFIRGGESCCCVRFLHRTAAGTIFELGKYYLTSELLSQIGKRCGEDAGR